jgi:hypothetical protein
MSQSRPNHRICSVALAGIATAWMSCATQHQALPPNDANSASNAAASLALAKQWFERLRDHDSEALASATQFPFEYQTTAEQDPCRAVVSTLAELRVFVACVSRDPLFMTELRHADDLGLTVVSPNSLPPWAHPRLARMAQGPLPIHGYINGDGVSYEFVLWLQMRRVQALYLHAEFERG